VSDDSGQWILYQQAYEGAISYSLGTRTDYAQVVKIYGVPIGEEDDHKYSPSKIK